MFWARTSGASACGPRTMSSGATWRPRPPGSPAEPRPRSILGALSAAPSGELAHQFSHHLVKSVAVVTEPEDDVAVAVEVGLVLGFRVGRTLDYQLLARDRDRLGHVI